MPINDKQGDPVAPAACHDEMRRFLRWRYGDQSAPLLHGDAWTGALVAPGTIDGWMDKVGNQRAYFHVSELDQVRWAAPETHECGRVTSANNEHVIGVRYIGFDVDAKKFGTVERQPDWQSQVFYSQEREQIAKLLSAVFDKLGIQPHAMWHSGVAGVQGLFRLDRQICCDQASNMTGRLAMLFRDGDLVRGDINLAKPSQVLRIPGSVNPKRGHGREPIATRFLQQGAEDWLLEGCVTVEDFEAALDRAEGRMAEAGAIPDGAPVGDLDRDPRCSALTVRAKQIIREGYIAGEPPQHQKDPSRRAAWLWDACWEMAEAGMSVADMLAILKDQRFGIAKKVRKKHGNAKNAAEAAYNIVTEKKQRKEKRVARRSSVPEVAWRDIKDRFGNPAPSLANAVIGLTTLGIGASMDLFHQKIFVDYHGETAEIANLVGEISDDTLGAIRSLINNKLGLDVGDPNVLAAVKEVAREHAYDPVLDYLDECEGKWEGTSRLDTWLIDYCDAEDTPFVRAVGRKHMIASVRRARVPGCKYDDIMVWESPEGHNKSQAILTLAGRENFSDQTILGVEDKVAQEVIQGVWIFEIADLTGITRAEVNKVKAFASRDTDRARRAYGRIRENQPRRCTFWATTNDSRYLLSQTGNRRFLPVAVGRVDLDALRRDRDLLWGEAARAEAAGEDIMLSESLWAVAAEEQECRRVVDPWEDTLRNIPEDIEVGDHAGPKRIVHLARGADGVQEQRVASDDLLTHVLGKPRAQQISNDGQRVATIMQALGWERTKAGTLRVGGRVARGYFRPVEQHQPPKPIEAADSEQLVLPNVGCSPCDGDAPSSGSSIVHPLSLETVH